MRQLCLHREVRCAVGKFNTILLPGGWRVETWYDRHTRNWVSQLKDDNGNQVGDATYDAGGNGKAISRSRRMLCDRHREKFDWNTIDV